MPLIRNIVDFAKKHVLAGLISQLLVSIAAAVAFLVEFVLLVVWFMPVGKYGPPPTPTPIVPINTPAPGMSAVDTVLAILVVLGSLILFAWAVVGWFFWGAILYFRMKDKK